MQRALMHYFKPYNRELVLKALQKAGREDLIGFESDCLKGVPPTSAGLKGPADVHAQEQNRPGRQADNRMNATFWHGKQPTRAACVTAQPSRRAATDGR